MEPETCLTFELTDDGIKITFIGVTDWSSNTIMPIMIKNGDLKKIIRPHVSLGEYLSYNDQDYIRHILNGHKEYKSILKYELFMVKIVFSISKKEYSVVFYFPYKYSSTNHIEVIDKYSEKISKYIQRIEELKILQRVLV